MKWILGIAIAVIAMALTAAEQVYAAANLIKTLWF